MRKIFVVLVALLISNAAFAAQTYIVGRTVQVMTTADELFGQCMAKLDKLISSEPTLSACPEDWITFSCDGTFNTRAEGTALFDRVLFAQALDKDVTILVTDANKINGYCLGKHVIISR